MVHLHVAVLTQAVDAADALFEDGGVPRLVHVDDHGGLLQVQSDAAGIGAQEDPAARVLLELFDDGLALPAVE